MNDICGPSSEISSRSADLQRSLANKLVARLEGLSSPLYKLTWKHWDIAPQRQICALRASALRTSGSVSTGWRTPKLSDGKKSNRSPEGALKEAKRSGATDLNTTVALMGWPSPAARDWKSTASNQHGKNARPLNEVARIAGWPSPMSGTPKQKGYNEAGNSDYSRKVVALTAGWSTPTAEDGRRGTKPPRPQDTGHPLSQQAGWATPAAQEAGGSAEAFLKRKETAVQNGASLGVSLTSPSLQASVSGTTSSSSPAATAKPGQLNPALSRWLMGYPIVWDESGVMATR